METVPGRSLKTQSLACGALWKTGSWVHTQAVGSRLCGHSLVLFLVLSSASWCTEKWGALVSHWHCHKLGGVNWNWVPINLSFATLCLSVFCTVMRKDTAAQESGLEETIPFSLSQRLEWESSNSYTLSADPDQSVVQVPLCRRLSLTRCTGHSGTNEGFFFFYI